MSRWLLLPLMVLPLLAGTASGAQRDRDRDGLPDRWEKRFHLSTSKKSAKGDPDRDGLRNLREYRLRTNPRRKDTDGDGLSDRAEVRRYKTNPRKKDTDGDGRHDRVELAAGTNPRKKDTDGDGYADRDEVRAGTDPKDPGSYPGSPAPGPSPSPTPSPTPAPSGCALPAFPDAGCTGVPAGKSLTASGSITISTAGTVIDGREVTGAIVVNAPNVTIRNTRVRSNAFRAIENNSTGLLVEDVEIINRPVSGQPNCHNGIGWGNFTMRRTEITGCENAVDVGDGNLIVEDSYFHDLDTTGPSAVWGNTPHTDGFQGSGSNVIIRHNYIDPTATNSGADAGIIMGTNTPNSNYRIEDNYIDGRGASYAIYAPRQSTPGIVINRNRLLKGYGYTACVRLGITVAEFTGNHDANTNALLSPDNGADGGCSN